MSKLKVYGWQIFQRRCIVPEIVHDSIEISLALANPGRVLSRLKIGKDWIADDGEPFESGRIRHRIEWNNELQQYKLIEYINGARAGERMFGVETMVDLVAGSYYVRGLR